MPPVGRLGRRPQVTSQCGLDLVFVGKPFAPFIAEEVGLVYKFASSSKQN